MKQFIKHIGLDVHKDTIAVSIADPGRINRQRILLWNAKPEVLI